MTSNQYDAIIIGGGHNRGAKAHLLNTWKPFGLADGATSRLQPTSTN